MKPHPMPVNAREYGQTLSLTHFVNAYHQVSDALSLAPKRVLIVGVGTALEPLILRHKFGLSVTTLDIDPRFEPDVVGSVHDMSMFATGTFDVAIISHVLEHLPFSYFEASLAESARVADAVILYLPYAGRHLEARFSYAQRVREAALRVTIPPCGRVGGERPELQAGHHYWELGYRGFSVRRIARIVERFFVVVTQYHNQDWRYSYNFVLRARRALGTIGAPPHP